MAFYSRIVWLLMLLATSLGVGVSTSYAVDMNACVIEELVFQVAAEQQEEFCKIDAEVWTKFLSKQPGFLDKHVWTNAHRGNSTAPDTVRFVIRWKSFEDWNRVPRKALQETDRTFKERLPANLAFNHVKTNAYREQSSESFAAENLEAVVSLEMFDDDWLESGSDIRVPYDPVYGKAKRYRAVSFTDFLSNAFTIERFTADETEVVFTCSDGYSSVILLSEVLASEGWIAVADLEAPEGSDWLPIKKGNAIKDPAPYAIVWSGGKPRGRGDWPYAVTQISLLPRDEFYQAAAPDHAPTHRTGFQLFRRNCMSCHAINGVGGKLGVELNAPRSVTTYWKEADLRGFIRQPTNYRHNSKMPAQSQLSEEQLDAIIGYLKSMAGHKTKLALTPPVVKTDTN